MKKRLLVVLTAILICMIFCGCDAAGNADDMVSPPSPTGDMRLIADALYKSAGTDCNLKYPASGDRRSAIVLEDVSGDANFEAFAFYSTSDDEMTTMHINAICLRDGNWVSVADQTVVAIGVDMVEFCDLNNDGTQEILVGWEVNGNNEKQLSVFTFDDNTLNQLIIQAYTDFLCCDLDNNGVNEIFVHWLNTAEKTNKAIVYNYNDGQMEQTAGCVMDSNVKSAAKPVLSTLSNGQKAIYIDQIKGVGAVTEVLYISKGELINPLLDTVNSFENISTLRAASLEIYDINNDGILEIPVASDLPNVEEGGEKLYYTNWCSFNGEKLSVKLITVVNTVDGYYLTIPNNMVGGISVLKDTENHERTFYNYDAVNEITTQKLFKIKAVDIVAWDSKDYARDQMVEILRNDSTVFVLKIDDYAKQIGITEDFVKQAFNLVK